jgi:hypothetical protein
MTDDPILKQLPEPVQRYIERCIEARIEYERSMIRQEHERARTANLPVAPSADERSTGTKAKASRRGKRTRSEIPKAERGSAPKLVREYLESVSHAVGRSEIVKAIRERHGVLVAFISVRRAIEDLVAEGQLEKLEDQNAWRWVGGRPAPTLRAVS